MRRYGTLLLGAGLALTAPLAAQESAGPPRLIADPHLAGTVPVPAAERGIPTVTAERWLTISAEPVTLEGAAFDRDGQLLLCDVDGSRVLRVSQSKQMSVVLERPGLKPGGLALNPGGRLFVAASDSGMIAEIRDGALVPALPTGSSFAPNDLVFDRDGGFYFTDFKGSLSDPAGGVYYVPASGGRPVAVVRGLALANGIALAPDGKRLWVTEFGTNRLLRIELDGPGKVARLGLRVAYQFIGPAPDSMRVDARGNAYVALNGQGRVLIFSPGGIPIGQILLPGREQGHNLFSASLALRPGSDEVYIVAADKEGTPSRASAVFRARTFSRQP